MCIRDRRTTVERTEARNESLPIARTPTRGVGLFEVVCALLAYLGNVLSARVWPCRDRAMLLVAYSRAFLSQYGSGISIPVRQQQQQQHGGLRSPRLLFRASLLEFGCWTCMKRRPVGRIQWGPAVKKYFQVLC